MSAPGKILTFCHGQVPSSPETRAALGHLVDAVAAMPLDEAAPPADRAETADPDLGEVVPPLPFPAGLSLSIEAEIIAECLYRAHMIATSDGVIPVGFDRLSPVVRQAFRDAAIIAIQRLNPHVHAAAVRMAETVTPGFEDTLRVYLAALTYGPAAVGAQ